MIDENPKCIKYDERYNAAEKYASELMEKLTKDGLSVLEVQIIANLLKRETAHQLNKWKYDAPFQKQ